MVNRDASHLRILALAGDLSRRGLGRELPNENYDLPDFVVAERLPPAWHARGTDAVLNDPFELAVLERLQLRRIQRRHRRRHLVSEDHPAIQAIGPVTAAAIVLELLSSFSY